MPTVCGSRNSAPNPRTVWPSDSGVAWVAVSAWAAWGSRTFQKIKAQASAARPASTPNPQRHDDCSTSHASGVPVNSMPSPPTPMAAPDTAAKRDGAK